METEVASLKFLTRKQTWWIDVTSRDDFDIDRRDNKFGGNYNSYYDDDDSYPLSPQGSSFLNTFKSSDGNMTI